MKPLRRLPFACVLLFASFLAPAVAQDVPPPPSAPPGQGPGQAPGEDSGPAPDEAGNQAMDDGSQPVTYQAFYDGLVGSGRWVNIAGYGSCWQPAGVDAGWAPYVDGHWAYTDDGWTWVSDEPWGWAVYHYGRWVLTPQGWFWVPGYAWGPCWVRWRYGNGYCGWAPLPPQNVVIHMRWYNFCRLNDIGSGRMRDVILERGGNSAYFGQTSGGFHRRGPDIAEINDNAFRKVPRLNLRRNGGPYPARPRQVGGDLHVYAPQVTPPTNDGPWHSRPAPRSPGAPSRPADHGARPDRGDHGDHSDHRGGGGPGPGPGPRPPESHPAPAPAPRPAPSGGGVHPSGGTTPGWMHH